MKQLINCTTGEIVERELSADELAQQKIDHEKSMAEKTAQQIEAAALADAKSALLEKLGISEDEAKLLLS